MAIAAVLNPRDCFLRLTLQGSKRRTRHCLPQPHARNNSRDPRATDASHAHSESRGLCDGLQQFILRALVDFDVTMGALRDLRCIELTQCTAPTVPGTLTALTRLAVSCERDGGDSCTWRDFRTSCDVAQLTALQVRAGNFL